MFFPVFVAALVAVVVWLVQRSSAGPVASSTDPALDILRERYARGEINREEYERMREDLKN